MHSKQGNPLNHLGKVIFQPASRSLLQGTLLKQPLSKAAVDRSNGRPAPVTSSLRRFPWPQKLSPENTSPHQPLSRRRKELILLLPTCGAVVKTHEGRNRKNTVLGDPPNETQARMWEVETKLWIQGLWALQTTTEQREETSGTPPPEEEKKSL